ncbi:hypothetical protein KKA39_01440 [Patescibacteria group bacterium]|nr:hypothetical protein [Patescibacteria group bacterium]
MVATHILQRFYRELVLLQKLALDNKRERFKKVYKLFEEDYVKNCFLSEDPLAGLCDSVKNHFYYTLIYPDERQEQLRKGAEELKELGDYLRTP